VFNKITKNPHLLLIILCCIGLNANSEVNLIIPKEFQKYKTDEPGKWYVLSGDRNKIIQEILPKKHHSEEFLEDWFQDGIYSYIIISNIKISRSDTNDINFNDNGDLIVPHEISNKSVYENFLKDLEKQWGKGSFSYYDEGKDVARFINEWGAFVFITFKVIGDDLVVVESMDLAHTFIAEKKGDNITSLSALNKIEYYKKASNLEYVDEILGIKNEKKTILD